MTKTVTFQTILDTARETEKAYKVWTGQYLPKSQVTIVDTGKVSPRNVYGKFSQKFGDRVIRVVNCPVVMVTMPEWMTKQ